jgi:predicted SAM-dependent methyltransferase
MGWKHTLATGVFSRHFVQALKSEASVQAARLRCLTPSNRRRLRALRHARGLSLNLGAGFHRRDGWTPIDLMVDPPGGIRWDVRWGLPFETGSVRRIHCEHFVEHLRLADEVMPALAECFRVLEPGGELRIIVPDAARYIHAYARGDAAFFDAMRDLGGAAVPFETDIEIVNQAFRMGGDHQFAWDFRVMRRRLESVGFDRIEETGYDPVRFIDQGDEWRRRESLYVAAYKPEQGDQRGQSRLNSTIAAQQGSRVQTTLTP